MKIDIGEKTINFPDAEVQSCRKVAGELLEMVREKAKEKGYYTYYFTFIFTIWMITQQMINDMDPFVITQVMDLLGGKKRGPIAYPDEMKSFEKAVEHMKEITKEQ